MRDNLPLYLFISVLFVMGVIFGSLLVNALSPGQKEELARHVNSFIQLVSQGGELAQPSTIWDSYSLHIKWIALIWVLGLSIIGLPLIFVLDFLKGVLLGFSVGYLVGQLSWKGLLLAFVSVAPQNLIVVPALVLCSAGACSFSLYVIKNRLLHSRGPLYPLFVRYTSMTVSMAVLLIGVALLEVYVSPIMIHWVAPMIVAQAG
jgi:stage II sporulation protein M